MPNWCENKMIIVGDKKSIEEFNKKYCSPFFSFDKIIPPPQNPDDCPKKYIIKDNNTYHPNDSELTFMDKHFDWYEWNCDHWGTKWNIGKGDVFKQVDENKMELSFDTAWAPPLPVVLKLIKQNPNLKIRMVYYEPGVGFAGFVSTDGKINELKDIKYFEDGSLDRKIAKEVQNDIKSIQSKNTVKIK